jgi:hypothetical protein
MLYWVLGGLALIALFVYWCFKLPYLKKDIPVKRRAVLVTGMNSVTFFSHTKVPHQELVNLFAPNY